MADRHVISAFQKALKDRNASPIVQKALFESGIVEAHLTNPAGGDKDSEGSLQQRPSSGYKHPRDPYRAALDFIDRAQAVQHQYGSAAALAQAVQRSAYPDKYAAPDVTRLADQLRRGLPAGGGAGSSDVTPTPDLNNVGLAQDAGNGALAQLLTQAAAPPPPPVSAPAAPAFSAQPVLPQGYQPQQTGFDPAAQTREQALSQQLSQALAASAGTPARPPVVDGTDAPTGAPAGPVYGPLGKKGLKIIGGPYQGTHAKAFNQAGGSDNWQSENADDIAAPKGTPVYAVANGVLGNTGSLGQGGRFAGLRTNLITKGNAFYYAHLSKLVVKQGQRVRKGQLLGYSGVANGVAHLHFAVEKGNPGDYYR